MYGLFRKKSTIFKTLNIVADVRYKSICNYEYLKKMGYNSYQIYFKKVKYYAEFRTLLDNLKENISSNYRKQLRLNRSIQVKRTSQYYKENMKFRKLKTCYRIIILKEIESFCMSYNFNRYISRSLKNCKGTILHPLQTT